MTNRTRFSWGRPTPTLAPTRFATIARHDAPAIARFVYGDAPRLAPSPLRLTRAVRLPRIASLGRTTSARQERLSRWGLVGATVVALLAATACGVAGASPAEGANDSTAAAPEAEPPAMAVEVTLARGASIATEVAVPGRIEAVQAIDVRPEVEGRIVAIIAQEGQAVASGAPLFRVDDAELKAQVARATAERDLAQQAFARTRGLLAEQASSRADLERAEALARSAQAQLDLLAVRLARTTVRAPFSGVVGRRYVSIGDFVSPQVRLAALQTTNPQRVALDVPERFAASLKRGQRVDFGVAAFPGRRFTATVDFVDPLVALPARTVTVKGLASNGDGALQAGMFAEARVATATRNEAVLIPEEALMPAPGGKNAVWVVVNGAAQRREVTLGVRRAGEVEITSGVSIGDQVVVGGVLQLMDGAPVQATVIGDVPAIELPARRERK